MRQSNLLLPVPICSYPFTLEPSGSVCIPIKNQRDTNGKIRFLRKQIRIDTNRYQRIPPSEAPVQSVPTRSYLFLSVHAGTVWFRLYPHKKSTGYQRKNTVPEETDTNRYQQIPTDPPQLYTSPIRCYLFLSVHAGTVWFRLYPHKKSTRYQRKNTVPEETDTNRYQQIPTDPTPVRHQSNLLLPVPICSYPFMLEPSGSVLIQTKSNKNTPAQPSTHSRKSRNSATRSASW